MGKTPGKWIKTLLLGKKSSKSSEKLKSANKEEVVVSVKDALSNLSVDPPSVSPSIPAARVQNVADTEKVVSGKPSNDGVNLSSAKEIEGDGMHINLESQNEPGTLKHQQAATKVQAAFRGHQARRAFRTLKGIIRLQAVIRGHLVRRQAMATFSCVWGIVKFQALFRGRKVRRSDIGIEIQKRHSGGGNKSEASRVSKFPWMEKPSKFAIVQKLLVSSPTPLPLRLQYAPGEPDSSWDWLERWTRLQIWALHSPETKNLSPNSQAKKGDSQTVDTVKGRPKRSIKKPASANAEKSSGHSTLESARRNIRKVSVHSTQLSREPPKTDTDKLKQNLRKTPNSLKEASEEKPRPSLKKVNVPVKTTTKSAEKRKDMTDDISKVSDLDSDKKSAVIDNPEQEDLQTADNNGKTDNITEKSMQLYSENDNVNGEDTKASERRASLPAKIDLQDDGVVHGTRKVPSYMAPTESARARVRVQGSPRFSQDRAEKNSIARRHSLPSSANGKLNTMSPQAQRLVVASGKGSINGDKSLSSSRDASDKLVRAEWKR